MKLKNLILSIILSFLVLVSACKKDDGAEAFVPRSDFSISKSNWYMSTTFQFTNKAVYAATYLWDFGDGTTSSNPNPTHKFSSSGDFTIKLTVTNSSGKTAVSQRTITVLPIPTQVKIKSIKLNTISLSGWDAGNGPDIYFKIQNGSSLIYTSKEIKQDVTASMLPLTWTLANAVSVGQIKSDEIELYFLDDDNGTSTNMSVLSITLDELRVNDYLETATIKLGSTNCEVTFEYQ